MLDKYLSIFLRFLALCSHGALYPFLECKSLRVVIQLDILGYLLFRVFPCLVQPAPDQFLLQRLEEGFCHDDVLRITGAGHLLCYPV